MHVISRRWTSAGQESPRGSWSQHLWIGPVPGRLLPLYSEDTGLSRWLTLLGRGCRAFWASVAPATCWRWAAGVTRPLSLSVAEPLGNQKRQEPCRPQAWRRSADRERVICWVVECMSSAACTAWFRAACSSSRSLGSSWMWMGCLSDSEDIPSWVLF